MSRASDPQNEKAETAGRHQRAGKIETVRRPRGVRQCLQTDQDRNDTEGDVEGKQPGPRSNHENARGDGRAKGKGRSDDQRISSGTQSLQAPRIKVANQRRIHTHNPSGAEALQHPGRQQSRQRPCARAEKRGQRKQQQAYEVNPMVSVDLAKCGERKRVATIAIW
jgi:hypothetical protein